MKRLALLAAPIAAALLSAAPAPAHAATTLSADSFSRQISGGWGAPSTGGSWSILQGPATAFSVDGSRGVVSTPAGYGNIREVHMPGSVARDVDVTAKLTLDAVTGTGARSHNAIIARRQTDGRYLRVGLVADSGGNLTVNTQTHLYEEIAPNVSPGFRFAAGTYNLRVQVQGAAPTWVRTKVWKEGSAEPTGWLQQTRTEKGPRDPGTVGLRTLAVSTPAALTTKVDDLTVLDASPPKSDPTQWRQVFNEDFDGTTLDTTKWSAFYGAGHGGNGVRRPSQVKVENGNLVLTSQMINGVLTSGGIAGRTGYTYGRFEFRVRTDRDPSNATSGIVLTWPQAGGWPATGENDIYETGYDGSRTSFYSFIHYGATNQQHWFRHSIDASQWQVMAMEWEANALRIFRNGELVYTVTDPETIPDVAHRLGVQLDAGKPTMTGVVRQYVDYLRVYTK